MTEAVMVDVAVVGGGIGALSAGLFAASFGLRTAIVTEIMMGGELINLEEVVRYPGLPEALSGSELASRVEAQALDAGADFIFDDVTSISQDEDGFLVEGASTKLRARAVIAAMGARRRRLGLAGEATLEGKGLSYCGTCDGPLFKDRAVAVVGDHDFAAREALVVARYAAEVTLIARHETPELSPETKRAIESEDRIRVLANSAVAALMTSDGLLQRIKVLDQSSGIAHDVELSGLFVNIGMEPSASLLAPLLGLEPGAPISVDAGMRTSIPGVFAVGELRQGFPGYAVSAAGDGTAAAASARHFLQGQA